MTIRSVVLGLLGAFSICGLSFFNSHVINQDQLVPNQFPPIVYFCLILGVGLLFGLGRFSKKLQLTAAEWAVIVALILVGCGLPGWGLVENIPATAIMTHRYAKLEPGWQGGAVDVVETVPKGMLVDLSDDDGTVLNGYITGLGRGDAPIAVSDVPWSAWAVPLSFWLPLALAMTIGCLGLAAVVHRQWLKHENLPYPLTSFAEAILPNEEDGTPSMFRNRLFWGGAISTLVLYSYNYLASWFPRTMISIPLRVELSSLYEVLPWLGGPGYRYSLSFVVVGIAYFIRSNVAMSVGVVPYIYTAIALVLTANGISLTGGNHVGGNYNAFLYAGGYLGIFLLMLYTGRHYYRNALQQGLFFPTTEETPSATARHWRAAIFGAGVLVLLLWVIKAGWLLATVGGVAAGALHGWVSPKLQVKTPVDPNAVWGVRLFLSCMIVFMALLVSVGLDWQLTVLFTVIAIITVTAISRAVAETGAFLFGTFFTPAPLILGCMGAVAVGPESMLVMGLMGSALLLAPGWAPMPFMVQALSIADRGQANVLKTVKWGTVVVVVGIPLALACALYFSYDSGAPINTWPHVANQYPGRDLVQMSTKLEAQGVLDTAQSLQGWQRFAHLSPEWPHITALLITTGLALLFGWLGLRFVGWPFHPVMFLFLGSFHGQWMSVSLLVGCGLKVGVIRFSGAAMYTRLKPLMLGLIGGSLVAATIPAIVGAIYFLFADEPPPRIHLGIF